MALRFIFSLLTLRRATPPPAFCLDPHIRLPLHACRAHTDRRLQAGILQMGSRPRPYSRDVLTILSWFRRLTRRVARHVTGKGSHVLCRNVVASPYRNPLVLPVPAESPRPPDGGMLMRVGQSPARFCAYEDSRGPLPDLSILDTHASIRSCARSVRNPRLPVVEPKPVGLTRPRP
jgi:hypothetical protein